MNEATNDITYSYACGNIVNSIKTNGPSSLEKYTSHFIRKGYERVVVWEVSWKLNEDCNILTPGSSSYSSISFPFSWAALSGAWGPSCCWDLVLSSRTGTTDSKLCLQTPDFLSHPGYKIVWHPPASCGVTIRTEYNPSTVKVIPRYLRPDAPVIYTGAFLIWQLGRVGGQHVTMRLEFTSERMLV